MSDLSKYNGVAVFGHFDGDWLTEKQHQGRDEFLVRKHKHVGFVSRVFDPHFALGNEPVEASFVQDVYRRERMTFEQEDLTVRDFYIFVQRDRTLADAMDMLIQTYKEKP